MRRSDRPAGVGTVVDLRARYACPQAGTSGPCPQDPSSGVLGQALSDQGHRIAPVPEWSITQDDRAKCAATTASARALVAGQAVQP
jgi:hypothetical protein